MVGIKSSKGCATCLRRSVKCDEQRPTCYQCRRGGRACPGYERAMTFVDEGIRLSRQCAAQRTRQKRHHSIPQQNVRVGHDYNSKHQTDFSSPHLSDRSIPTWSTAPLHLASATAELNQLVASFVAGMFPLGVISQQASLLGTWLWHIPPRLGSNATLDYAALSMSLAYFGKAAGDGAAAKRAELAYLTAIRSLSSALSSDDQKFDAEVLGATMLLGHYESLSGTSHAWIRHAGGAAQLMRLRGARRSYESAFEYAMFVSCRGAIISHALHSEARCFLEDGSWQAIPDGLIDFPLLPSAADLYHTIFRYFAMIPGLIKRFRDLSDAKCQIQVDELLSKTATLCHNMRKWYDAFTSSQDGRMAPSLCSKQPISTSMLPFQDAYVYFDVASASIITTYCAYRILLQREVDAVMPGTYTDENIELAETICKSIDYLSNAGYCGMQTMRLALPIAQSIAPAKYQAWITSKTSQID